MLIGLGKMFKNVASTLASKILGYVYTPSPGSGYYTTTTGVSTEAFAMLMQNSINGKHKMVYTADGISWAGIDTQGLPDYNSHSMLKYANGTWVTGSNTGLRYSADGINWSESNISNLYVYKIAHTGATSFGYENMWAAMAYDGSVGNYQILFSSDNARSWTALSLSSGVQNLLNSANGSVSIVSIGGAFAFYLSGSSTGLNINYTFNTNVNTFDTGLSPLTSMTAENAIVLYVNNNLKVVLADNKDIYYSTDNSLNGFTKVTEPFGSNIGTIKLYKTKTRVNSSDNTLFKDNLTAIFFNFNENARNTSYSVNAVDWSGPYPFAFSGPSMVAANIMHFNDKLITHDTNSTLQTVAYSSYITEAGVYNNIYTSTDLSEYNPGLVISEVGIINTLKETQISIGGQGSGETVEALGQVDVYTVPSGKSANISMITIENLSSNQITYDLGIVNTGTDLTESNTLKWDQPIAANSTATILNVTNPVTAGKTIYVFPSAVDQVQVKVYGTETSV